MERLIRVMVPTLIAAAVVVAGGTLSGAPAPVHIVEAVGVVLSFWLPAQFISRPETLLRKWPLALCCIIGGTLVWDILTTLVIAKREFLMGAIVLYPGAVVVFGILLLVSAGLTAALNQGLTRRCS